MNQSAGLKLKGALWLSMFLVSGYIHFVPLHCLNMDIFDYEQEYRQSEFLLHQ